MQGPQEDWSRGRLARFLGVSVAAHLVLLLGWSQPVPTMLPASPGGPVSVTLKTAARPAPPASAAETPPAEASPEPGPEPSAKPEKAEPKPEPTAAPTARNSAPTPEAAVRAREDSDSAAAGQPREKADGEPTQRARPEQTASEPASAAASPAFDEARARDRVRAHLRRDLARYFSYPVIAQRRGWQGKVVLSFSVDTDGRIGDISVARSSGHAVLDRSAVEALGRVDRLTLQGGGPPRALRDVRIPVIYRLEG